MRLRRSWRTRGIKVAHGARALADERHVKDLIVLNDPVGNRLEIFHGAETTAEPFKPGRSISGFRTGPLGLGHVVLNVDTRGNGRSNDGVLSRHARLPVDGLLLPSVRGRFLHLNPRHHSLAFVQTGKNTVHHLMMELFSFDDVGQGYDLASDEEGRVARDARPPHQRFHHLVLSFTPSGFMVEYGWGARLIDVDAWQAHERKEGPSMWGHDRGWLSAEDQAKARALRIANAANGFRRPVQVMDGNYEVMSGVCPWWDSIRSKTAAR